MKQNQKIALMVMGILGLVGLWQSAQALTTEERTANRTAIQTKTAERQKNITEKKETMDAKRTANKERIEEKKEEMQQKRTEMRARRQERFQKIATGVTTKIENITVKLEKAGIDTSNIETYLTELKVKNDLVEKVASSLDAAYDAEEAELIKEEREDLKTVVKDLRDYYHNTLRPAIKVAILEARPDLTE